MPIGCDCAGWGKVGLRKGGGEKTGWGKMELRKGERRVGGVE